MKLKITLCYSILEYCLANRDPLDSDGKGAHLLNRFKQHRINLNDLLLDEWESYFRINRPNLLSAYQGYIEKIITNIVESNMITNISSINNTQQKFNSTYEKILLGVCCSTEDKILIDENPSISSSAIHTLKINRIKKSQILCEYDRNLFNDYTLPIQDRKICSGESNEKISRWIGSFLTGEKDIIIIDSYISENEKPFQDYLLKYIDIGANIAIYTCSGNYTESQIRNKFSDVVYNKWNIEVYLFKNTFVQHSRKIITNKYRIHLEKGAGVFGKNQITAQSDISIYDVELVGPYLITDFRKIL